MRPHALKKVERQSIIKTNLNLMVFIQEIIYQKKHVAYVINIDEFKSIGNHLITLHVNVEKLTYFDSFGVEQKLENSLEIKIL